MCTCVIMYFEKQTTLYSLRSLETQKSRGHLFSFAEKHTPGGKLKYSGGIFCFRVKEDHSPGGKSKNTCFESEKVGGVSVCSETKASLGEALPRPRGPELLTAFKRKEIMEEIGQVRGPRQDASSNPILPSNHYKMVPRRSKSNFGSACAQPTRSSVREELEHSP